MSSPEHSDAKELVRAHYDAVVNRFDPEAIRSQVAKDFFDHQSGRPMSAEDVIAHARAMHTAFADLRVTLDQIIAEGDCVAVRGTWRGVHVGPVRGFAPSGQPVVLSGMVFWRVRDGRVTERWAEIDFSRLATAAPS